MTGKYRVGMKRLRSLLFLILFCSFQNTFAEVNPWSLDIQERIINRKQVNKIVIETRKDHYRVTLLVCDRFPYNYKSQSYPFFIKVLDSSSAYKIAKYLDSYLETGNNLYIRLNGSEIIQYSPSS